ncbi:MULTISPECIES: hypothetical protein [Maritimibacter]|uniref:Uncharacterized protein n=1 Tax=Maritimibacter alkaliphilus HTCC2654 TaxID=314271 RepID=A3VLS8_9RHOB|nr:MULTISPECIES: hypothetical protein [Maritimibacter]EAQ10763.1 hypothetical protein RB2654_05562 [Rhodobacterales bacterium HTCC2654] [Maritimibacter alkaliphilus HTCC2654]MBL6429294.1 hypothetical protein [Maritimibacter sp.]TYP81682.1 hypothetical protein BD830_105352 [Maritimibacter alkaliphilus HTCC2654]
MATKAKKEKPVLTPEEMARKKAVKLIGYHGWLTDWKRDNPEADVEARRAAWGEAKGQRMRDARRVVKRLEKGGLQLVAAPTPEAIAAE